ncbi:flagellar hook-length control protein FliK [Roseivivax sp. THAF197b]|uniref:flagellar hook-length control protein FliK n=1 Tax=Roseivivax sp. THAF197b TaxID=2588299 RepID=UPI0012A87077|nr:flagellar hook-length control protein FliK [Roseivivax sp. THAF197b]QFS84785.1 Flagellar hook-length control protein FliK [Roseivivax sp. THAF197b]
MKSSVKFPELSPKMIGVSESRPMYSEKSRLFTEQISTTKSAPEIEGLDIVTQVRPNKGLSFHYEPSRLIKFNEASAKDINPAAEEIGPATKTAVLQSEVNSEVQTLPVSPRSFIHGSDKTSYLEAETSERMAHQEGFGLASSQTDGVSRAQNSTPSISVSPQAQPILRKIAEHLRVDASGVIDLRLEPEELGRLRIAISAGEAGFNVQIVGDRMETVDLLRRHAAALERVFSDAGLDLASFGFGTGSKMSDRAQLSTDDNSVSEAIALPAPSSKAVPGSETGRDGLDLRL